MRNYQGLYQHCIQYMPILARDAPHTGAMLQRMAETREEVEKHVPTQE